jgi:hypothetical protein
MAAPVPTYRTAIPQSTPLAHAAAAVCATDAPAIQAGSPRSIMDLILQDFEIERRKLLQQENGFPIPAEARPTATEMLDSELRRHKLRTEHIAVEDRMPPWAEQFMGRMEGTAAETNARLDTMIQNMNTRFDAVDARFETIIVDINTRFDAVNARFAALQVSVDAINRDIATLNEGARGNTVHLQGMEHTINLIFQNFVASDAPITVMQQTLADIRVAITQLQQGQTAMARYQTVVDNAIDNIDN